MMMKNTIKFAMGIAALGLACTFLTDNTKAASESTVSYTLDATGFDCIDNSKDANYYSFTTFSAGGTMTVHSDESIQGIYLEWHNIPEEYHVNFNGTDFTGGTNDFLHEYIEVGGANDVLFTFDAVTELADVYVIGEGEIPDSVQIWEPQCDKADFLVVSTHSDDEILWLGAVLAQYGGVEDLDVQVLYFFDYTETWHIREHEKLDGLWAVGIKHYPDKGLNKEQAVASLDNCKEVYDYTNALGWLVGKVRKYQPLVVVTQDVNGEYGHAHHLMMTQMVMDAVNISGDENQYTESADEYGVYDVPKTYIHLYPENTIQLDVRTELSELGGRTIFDVVSNAYTKHVTQQEFWFYVSDDNEYSIRDFGLYRTTVGTDTGNDMMENLVSYEEQERLEQERIEQESIEAESIAVAEAEAASREEAEAESISEAESIAESSEEAKEASDDKFSIIVMMIIAGVLMVCIIPVIIFLMNEKKKK